MVRGKNHQSDGDREVAVDVTLEVDVRATEEAIDAYLSDPSASRRDALVGRPGGARSADRSQ